MDKNKIILIVGILTLGVGVFFFFSTKKGIPSYMENGFNPTQGGRDMGSSAIMQDGSGRGVPTRGNCLSDDCLLVEDLEYPVDVLPADVIDALSEAINDEYKALATYESVIEKFGSVRPFSMIKGAEEQHIASLKAIYDKYGVTVPDNTWLGNVVAPDTTQEACQIGIEAEIANASLYEDKLLPMVSDYEDIVAVFTNLMNASEQKHLPAFERCN